MVSLPGPGVGGGCTLLDEIDETGTPGFQPAFRLAIINSAACSDSVKHCPLYNWSHFLK